MSRISRVVCNASPLIYLAKAGELSILKQLYQEIMIPKEVFEETCAAQDSPDSVVISSAVSDGWIKIVDRRDSHSSAIAKSSGIHLGEAAAILLAREKKALLLIDDKLGRSTAEILGITCLGTVGVLLQSLASSTMNISEFVNSLDRMIDSGFRLDAKVYRQVMKVAKEISGI